MSAGAWPMLAAMMLAFGTLAFIVLMLVRGLRAERTRGIRIWRHFGLSLALVILFLVTWVAHGIAEWQGYTDEQRGLGQPVAVGDFVDRFAAATLENWQSEFLQVFTFVVLAGMLIHKGSASSKDGEERIEASPRRIEDRLGTLPNQAPKARTEAWKLPDTPRKHKVAG